MWTCVRPGAATAWLALWLVAGVAPAPLLAQNLLTNGGFEAATPAPWQGADASDLSTAHAYEGRQGLHLRAAKYVTQDWIPVTPGTTYLLTARFRWSAFSGDGWGFTVLEAVNDGWEVEGRLSQLHQQYGAGDWHGLAVSFVARTSRVRVGLGVFGPRSVVDLAFDDVRLVARTGNAPPTVSPVASVTSGTAPLAVTFDARADDPDGAVSSIAWDFGDGAAAAVAAPTHRYLRRGQFTARVTVWDNDGASASGQVVVNVSGDGNPVVGITAPTAGTTFTTAAESVDLAGTATAPAGRTLAGLVWDNVGADRAGAVTLGGTSASWAAEVPLKPGRNDILVTVTDSTGAAATTRLIVIRTIQGPRISNLQMACDGVRVYEPCEIRFDVETVADHPLFAYDPSPPAGAAPATGVTAEAVVSTPDGRTRRQPAFFTHEVTRSAFEGRTFYQTGPRGYWVARVAPLVVGRHVVQLRVEDASGVAETMAGSFDAQSPVHGGYVEVSRDDPRYFQLSGGEPFHPIGPASYTSYASPAGPGLNLDRPWLGGLGIYSTNWSRWMRVDKQLGNEGFDSPLTPFERYPSHELSREIVAPGAHRIWMGQFLDDQFFPRLVTGQDYLVKLRLKVIDLAGPADPSRPFGFVVKRHGFPSESLEEWLRAAPAMVPHIARDRDWHTVLVRYTPGGAEGDLRYFSLYLDNVNAGRAYIDQFSIRPLLADGSVGGELIRQSRADVHTYVEDRPAAAFDDQVAEAARHGVVLKVVVQDKRDWIYDHLGPHGVFAHTGGGYFQLPGTRAHWLQRQWWRYLAARWGASVAIHSWEACNEADPNDRAVWAHAQHFARFMHEIDSHPHLATTSFWCCWKPEFWGDSTNYPDVDYADLHAYSQEDPIGRDLAAWIGSLVSQTSGSPIGKPVMLAETGVGSPGQPLFEALKSPNPGVWYHNLLWGQLSGGSGLSVANYWFSEHLARIDAAAHAVSFARFVRQLELHRGGFVDAQATASDPAIRVIGQRQPARQVAYLWIHNRRHTWFNVMGRPGSEPVGTVSGTVTLTMAPSRSYRIDRYDTWTGAFVGTEERSSDLTGRLSIAVSGLARDVALLIGPAGVRAPANVRVVR